MTPSRRPPLLSLPTLLLAFAGLLGWPAGPGHTHLHGQTILNTERFQLEEVEGSHAAIELGGRGRRGHTRFFQGEIEGIVGYIEGRHWPRVIFGASYLREEGEDPILDQRFLQLRYSYLLSDRTRTFHFVQGQMNESLLLRSRWLVGGGVRRMLLRSDRTSIHLGTGAFFEAERLDEARMEPGDPRRTEVVRMANLAVLTLTFGEEAELVNVSYFQPRFDAPADFRMLNDLRLSVPVTERIGLRVTLSWRHDSRPPAALGRHDLIYGMGWTFELGG